MKTRKTIMDRGIGICVVGIPVLLISTAGIAQQGPPTIVSERLLKQLEQHIGEMEEKGVEVPTGPQSAPATGPDTSRPKIPGLYGRIQRLVKPGAEPAGIVTTRADLESLWKTISEAQKQLGETREQEATPLATNIRERMSSIRQRTLRIRRTDELSRTTIAHPKVLEKLKSARKPSEPREEPVIVDRDSFRSFHDHLEKIMKTSPEGKPPVGPSRADLTELQERFRRL